VLLDLLENVDPLDFLVKLVQLVIQEDLAKMELLVCLVTLA